VKNRVHLLSLLQTVEADVVLDRVIGGVTHVNACRTVNAIWFIARDAHQKVNAVFFVVYDYVSHHRRRVVARHSVRHGHEGEQKYNHRTLKSEERVAVEWIVDTKDDALVASDLVYHARFREHKRRKLPLSYFCDGAKRSPFRHTSSHRHLCQI
jgi:hypothetical protein